MHFKIGGFPKLKFLRLRHLANLNSLIIDEGGLPILVTLWVGPCPKLKEVPFGIQHLRDLKALLFRGIPKELEESLDPGHGPHYWIIEHVPIVNISCKVDTGNYDYDSRNQSFREVNQPQRQHKCFPPCPKIKDINASVDKGW